jgi:hypothetical protein
METNNSIIIDDYADAIAFYNVASMRHINLEDIENLANIINESVYGKKMRKINRSKKTLKIPKSSETTANSAK